MSFATVFACESQPIAVVGLAKALEGVDDLALVGSAGSYAESLALLADVRPDVVLVEQGAGVKASFGFLSDFKQKALPGLPVLWSTDLAEVEAFRALQLGVRGIVRKTLPISTLLDCLRAVARGEIWVEKSVSSQVFGFLNRQNSPRLTPREREIVRCLCRGMRNKEIAAALSITAGTVKVHLMHIFEKTGVKDRFELAAQGSRMLGLDFEPDPQPGAAATAGAATHKDEA